MIFLNTQNTKRTENVNKLVNIAMLQEHPIGIPGFAETLSRHNTSIRRRKVSTLQINIGKKCDLACHHCHVEAGPKNPDNMTAETVDRIIDLLSEPNDVEVVDITGGAPELNPHFKRLCIAVKDMGKTVYDRCNLTVLFEPGQETTAEFLAEHSVTVIASLPCYSMENVDQQRGKGVFDKSIRGLQLLNSLGYAQENSGLILNLVYNPIKPHLPPPQAQLEEEYHQQLKEHFGISFDALFTITNMPIKRYRHALERDQMLDDYMQLLFENFNPQATEGVMCTDMISVGFDGQLYDCDFNQMLEIPINRKPRTIWDIKSLNETESQIAFDDHCYGCTAGAGSSCGGALLEE